MPPGTLTQIAYCNDSKADLVCITTNLKRYTHDHTCTKDSYSRLKKDFHYIKKVLMLENKPF